MRYEEVVEIIQNKRRFGNLPGVEVSRRMLAAVENPHEGLPFIHIAGTNGKGSTAAFLRGITKEAGIKTGMFTSPHLVDFTERIQIDGNEIPKEDVVRIGEQLLALDLSVNPTMFDYCFVMAMMYFKEQGCRLVILETGLGGRLDSTNVIPHPLVTVITKIGYDHMEALGNTLREIAEEKAGIIKEKTVVISESQEPEVAGVLRRVCREKTVMLCEITEEELSGEKSGFFFQGEYYTPTMGGAYQWQNAAAAVLTSQKLNKLGYHIEKEVVLRGIEKSVWPGRMEVIQEKPYLLIDGAHNSHGVKALANSLRCGYPGEKFHFIMGVMADKDYENMIEDILPFAIDVTAVTLENERALKAETLARTIGEKGIPSTHCADMKEAFGRYVNKENILEKTVAFGSLYFVGDIKKLFNI